MLDILDVNSNDKNPKCQNILKNTQQALIIETNNALAHHLQG